MKVLVYNPKSEKKEEIDLPSVFSFKIREDIVAKCFEAEKLMKQRLYSTYSEAGKRHSASGILSHRRNKWKTAYGKGISRVPRKIMFRRGVQFFWIGAEVSGTRGGRQAHPPKGLRRERKINKKEKKIALFSAIASTAKKEYVMKRYGGIENVNIQLPIIIDSIDNLKVKEIKSFFKKILGNLYDYLFRQKTIRAGKGKRRGRKYKDSRGILIIKTKEEKIKSKGLVIKDIDKTELSDLYPLGRLTIFTKKAIDELNKMEKEK